MNFAVILHEISSIGYANVHLVLHVKDAFTSSATATRRGLRNWVSNHLERIWPIYELASQLCYKANDRLMDHLWDTVSLY